jgi:YkoY family integral membrane protein
MLIEMFGQTVAYSDAFAIATLIVLEGALSVDNALVLGLLANRLPPEQRKKALTYGLVGAFVFRFSAIAIASFLLAYPIVKLLGGGYLLYIAVKHLILDRGKHSHDAHPLGGETSLSPVDREHEIDKRSPVPDGVDASKPSSAVMLYAKFWPTVFVIELTDIAFAIDSIVAAIAFIPHHDGPGPNPKMWVVITGGFFGVILMRFAAMIFVKLLDRFPRFELAAYLLVTVIGGKLVFDYLGNLMLATEANKHPINFHDTGSPWFWTFWVLMVACFAYGFVRRKSREPA